MEMFFKVLRSIVVVILQIVGDVPCSGRGLQIKLVASHKLHSDKAILKP